MPALPEDPAMPDKLAAPVATVVLGAMAGRCPEQLATGVPAASAARVARVVMARPVGWELPRKWAVELAVVRVVTEAMGLAVVPAALVATVESGAPRQMASSVLTGSAAKGVREGLGGTRAMVATVVTALVVDPMLLRGPAAWVAMAATGGSAEPGGREETAEAVSVA